MLLPYKFQVIAVCQVVEDGRVVGEQIVSGKDGQPLAIFGLDGLHKFADSFEDQLRSQGES